MIYLDLFILLKSMINNSILLNAEDLLRAYNFKRINAINIVYLKYIKDIFIKIVLSNNIIYLQFYIQSGNIRRSKRFIDKQEFIDYLKQLMNGKTKL